MASIKTKQGRVGVIDEGKSGTPILFLHGVGSDKSVWQRQIDHCATSRRAVAVDYPGYGESAPATDGTTRDDYAAAVLAAMDSLNIERAHLCGLSLGGVVAIAIHAAASHRCASLIIADSFAVHPDGQAIYDRSVTASSDLRALAEARADVLLAPPVDPAVRSEVVETMAAIDPTAYRIGAEAVWLADQTERVREIKVPVLILCGAHDSVTPPMLSGQLSDLIPGSRFVAIGRSGHLPNIEQPDAFNALIERFVEDVEARARRAS